MKGKLKIQFFGDICCDSINDNQVNRVVADLFVKEKNADIRMANLECPIINNKYRTIRKTGPNLKSDKSCIKLLKSLSIDAVSLANNHVGDYGPDAVLETMNLLKNAKIAFAGAGANIENAYCAHRISVNGLNISFIAVCENEFGIAKEDMPGVAGYDVYQLFHAVKEEKKIANKVIVMMHGGNEFNPMPSPKCVKRYRQIIECGADVVVGTHPHCPQGYEYYDNGLIIYSLGNFYFPNNHLKNPYSSWYQGYIAEVSFTKDKVNIEPIPYRYSIYDKSIQILKGDDYKLFIDYIERISVVIKDMDYIRELFIAWSQVMGERYANRLSWYSQNINNYDIEIKNLFRCEAHNELMQSFFENCGRYNIQAWNALRQYCNIPSSYEFWKEEFDAFTNNEIEISNINKLEEIVRNKSVYICGAGKCGAKMFYELKQRGIKIKGVLDNDVLKQIDNMCGCQINPYSSIKTIDSDDVFIIAIKNNEMQQKVKQQILNMFVDAEIQMIE